MPLKEVTSEVDWPAVHYVYVEKCGPFEEVGPKCWEEFNANKLRVSEDTLHFLGYFSLFKPNSEMIYRAGGIVAAASVDPLPPGVNYMELEPGRYLQYVVMGNYAQLPEACQTVLQRVEDGGIITRGGWYVEHYVNREITTPEDELTTHILVPIPDHI